MSHELMFSAHDEMAHDVPEGAVRPAGMIMRWGRTVQWCRWTGDRWERFAVSSRGAHHRSSS